MSRTLRTLLWLVAVVAGSALILAKLDRFQARRSEHAGYEGPTARVFLIAYEGEEFPGREASGSYLRIGCQDILVPFEIPVVAPRLPSVLAALATYDPPAGLHNPLREKHLRFKATRAGERGETVVLVEGELQFGGICDTPRFKAQLEETVRLYAPKFAIWLNGSAKEFRCLDDMSGQCR